MALALLAKDSQQIKEEVDEVEVEREGAHERHLLRCLAHVGLHGEHLLDLLRVPSGEAHENHYASIAQHEVEHAVVEKQVDHRGKDEADERHEENATQLG